MSMQMVMMPAMMPQLQMPMGQQWPQWQVGPQQQGPPMPMMMPQLLRPMGTQWPQWQVGPQQQGPPMPMIMPQLLSPMSPQQQWPQWPVGPQQQNGVYQAQNRQRRFRASSSAQPA